MRLYSISTILIICLLQLLVSSCKKEAEACLFPSNSNPWVGEKVNFNNCSKNFNQALIDFGDGSVPINIKGNLGHTYYFRKIYHVGLTVYQSRNNEVDEAITSVPIFPKTPSAQDMEGNWLNYRLIGFDNVFFSENQHVFDAEVHFDSTLQVKYNFDASNQLLSTSVSDTTTRWIALDNGDHLLGSDSVRVVRFYNDSMYLILPYRYGYAMGYFKRVD